MDAPIAIDFDNLVFSLQKTGGGSIYWANLISRAVNSESFDVVFHDRTDSKLNLQRKFIENSIDSCRCVYSNLPLRIDEVSRVKVDRDCIFHSSYFRTTPNKHAINVVTIHDFICMKYFSGFVKHFQLNQMKAAVNHADAVICISESTKNDLFKYIPSSMNKNIEIIPQGYDTKSYRYNAAERLKRVVFVGNRSVSYKNFRLAVESVSKLNDVELHIIGSPLNDDEVRLLGEYLPGRFVSHVYPESSEVSRLYNSSAALLYLSEYEGFGLPLLEAMASGCPVIAQNKSSIPEVAGDSCILLDKVSPSIIANHIQRLCSFDNDFNALVESGLNRVRKYSWDQTAESTFAFYKSLIN